MDLDYLFAIFAVTGGQRFLPFKVSEVQPTPNPNAMKFVLDRSISDVPISFLDASSGSEHPVASKLFAVQGVVSVLLLNDFVTISKVPAARWADIKPPVQRVLNSL